MGERPRRKWGSHQKILLGLSGLVICLTLALSATAGAAIRQVGNFCGSALPPAEKGVFNEEVQCGGVGGLSVNVNGAGGVPAGTLYAAIKGNDGVTRIARFNPNGTFSEAWIVNFSEPPEVCGPEAPSPPAPSPPPPCPAEPEGNAGALVDVDVDQSTGNVYVLRWEGLSAGSKVVTEYAPDGSAVIARFAERGEELPPTNPEKFHESGAVGGIAVNKDGEVYVADVNPEDNFFHRVMVFKPVTPGDYTKYEYAGASHDIGAGFQGTSFPLKPVTDNAGNVYVASETFVEEYDPGQPLSPVCRREVKGGGITSISVNPDSGEVFYFSYKKVEGRKTIHQLSPCKSGTFEEPEPAGTEVSPERGDIYGLAYDPVRERLYAAAPGPVPTTGGTGQPGTSALGYVFAPVPEDPPSVVSEAAIQITATSAELQARINPRSSQTSYSFQYLPAEVFSFNARHPVLSVKATGGTFRLSFGGDATVPLAFNSSAAQVEAALVALAAIGPGNVTVTGGPGDEAGSSPYQIELAEGLGSLFELLAVDGSGLTGAGAGAEVNGFFAGSFEEPLGGAPLGGGSQPLGAGALISGLLPDTEYVFRVIAASRCKENKEVVCQVFGEPQAFRTYSGASVGPDGRAYELVSPAQKDGGEVFPAEPNVNSCLGYPECKPGDAYQHFPMQAAPDGNAVVYEGFSFSLSAGALIENEYLAHRGPSGWESVNLTPERLESKGSQGYKFFDTALTQSVLEQPSPQLSLAAPPDYPDLYLQPTAAAGSLTPLLTDEPLNHRPFNRVSGSGAGRLLLAFAGVSSDFSRAFFEANDALTEAAPPRAPEAVDPGNPDKENNLYEWSGGVLHLVNVEPGNFQAAPGAVFGSGSLLGGGTASIPASVFTHAVSDNGSRVFWTAANGKTYVRVNAAETIEVKGPGTCKSSVPIAARACFLAATPDASRVLLSNGEIYRLDQQGEGYDPATDLTEGEGGFQGVVGHTEDLAGIYFVVDPTEGTEPLSKGSADLNKGSSTLTNVKASVGTFAVGQTIEGTGIPAGTTVTATGAGTLELSANATGSASSVALVAGTPLGAELRNSEGAGPRLSGFNLYSWTEGGAATQFVATLSAGDEQSWEAVPARRMGEASPNGDFLTFLSNSPLTGYKNIGPCDQNSGKLIETACNEVFLYDTLTGELRCPSCNPTNGAPGGNSILRLILNVKGSLPQPHYLTNSGRLFFDSQDSLVAADQNGRAEDVYEYEPNGVGSCTREAGCVALISAGREEADSNFVAMDASGNNVFFSTRDRLVPADSDQLMDLYDARVGGGFASEAPPPCQQQVCRGPIPPPPAESSPSSQSVTGSGNHKPPKMCKKGQVKKNGKCMKKKQGKNNRQKRTAKSKKGGAR